MTKRRTRRSGGRPRPPVDDLWGSVTPEVLDAPDPVGDPTAVLRSLGSLPQPFHPALGDAQLQKVYQRAALMAQAIVLSASIEPESAEDLPPIPAAAGDEDDDRAG